MASILATGRALPENAVKNDDLARYMDTSDEWISQRSGIRERRWLRKGDERYTGRANHEMAYDAVLMACGGRPEQIAGIDAIVYATLSPDLDLPGSGVLLKEKLGIEQDIPVIEVRNQCSGFMYGLAAAEAYVNSGIYSRVLVVGSEIQSSGLDLSTEGRATAVLFADGCGCALIGPDGDDTHRILGCQLFSDGRHADKLCVRKPGFAKSFVTEADFEGDTQQLFPFMEGKFIFHMASQAMPAAVRGILSAHGYSPEDLKVIIPHQANQRILDMLSREFDGKIRVFSNIARYGNTTAASIPIALSEANEEGVLQPGDLICLTTFGSGVSWGAALIRW